MTDNFWIIFIEENEISEITEQRKAEQKELLYELLLETTSTG